jgi:hypothetical protein
MITNKRAFVALACIFLAVAAASQLRADEPDVLIAGSASFFGGASASGPDCDGCIVTLSFSNNSFVDGTGLYASIPTGTPVAFSSFSFIRQGQNFTLVNPVPMFWAFTFGGNNYSFDLLALSNAHVESSAMALTGTGTLHASGFDPTPAAIGMTAGGTNFVYQLSSVTSVVPEPTPLALAGFGLAISGAIAYVRRRRGTCSRER